MVDTLEFDQHNANETQTRADVIFQTQTNLDAEIVISKHTIQNISQASFIYCFLIMFIDLVDRG